MDYLAAALASVQERLAAKQAARKAAEAAKVETTRDRSTTIVRRAVERSTPYEAEARMLAGQGKTCRQIAEAVGMSPQAIAAWASRRGVKLAPAVRVYQDNFKNRPARTFDYAAAAAMYAAGEKIHIIARQFGVSHGSIRSARIAMGVPERRRAYTRKPKAEFVNGEGWV